MFIIGYMASGKTTFGRTLAKRLGREFIDLDLYIEQRFHLSVSEIFAKKGEEEFRRIESEMLREIGEFENVVISCGGGTPCFNSNMDYMLANSDVIFLNTPRERIVERLVRNNSRRPLMAGKSPEEITKAVDAGLDSRLPYYSQANIIFNGESLENHSQIDSTINRFIQLHPNCR